MNHFNRCDYFIHRDDVTSRAEERTMKCMCQECCLSLRKSTHQCESLVNFQSSTSSTALPSQASQKSFFYTSSALKFILQPQQIFVQTPKCSSSTPHHPTTTSVSLADEQTEFVPSRAKKSSSTLSRTIKCPRSKSGSRRRRAFRRFSSD